MHDWSWSDGCDLDFFPVFKAFHQRKKWVGLHWSHLGRGFLGGGGLLVLSKSFLREFLLLGGLHQVVDVDVEVVIEFDEVDGGFGLHLVDHHSRPLPAVLFGILDLFAHQTVDHLAGLSLCRHAVVYDTNTEKKSLSSWSYL